MEGCEDISIFDMLDVDVWDDRLCNRLTCRMVCNLSNFTTPHWLQQRLTDCGITPVGGIDDIANYVELELGQPLLLLDQRCCSGSLTLRAPFPGECADISGNFKNNRSGNTVFGQLQFAGTVCIEFPIMENLHITVGTHAF